MILQFDSYFSFRSRVSRLLMSAASVAAEIAISKEIIADYSRFNRSAGAQQRDIWSRWVFLRERAAEAAFTSSTSGCLYQTKPRWS